MIDLTQIITEAVSSLIKGFITTGYLFLLGFITIKMIIKKMPEWLNQYHNNRMKELALEKAIKFK